MDAQQALSIPPAPTPCWLRRNFSRSALIGVCIFGIGVLGWQLWPQEPSAPFVSTVTIQNKTWRLIGIADTDTTRARGLSRRPMLDVGAGLLFVFEVPGKYPFWMKDMQFPIDIIYARDGVVDSVARHRVPGDLTLVMPQAPINQVLEVNAGEADGIQSGDRLTIAF